MNFKRLSEFSLSMVLSLSALLVVAVPKVQASTSTMHGNTADNYLNTSLQMLTNSVLATLGVTMLAVGFILVVTKKFNHLRLKR